jgi:hypothetical protein
VAGGQDEGEEAKKLVISFLKSQRLDRTADYVARGRGFQALTVEALHEGWRASMHAMSLSPSEHGHWERTSDYESELALRGLSPPARCRKGGSKTLLGSHIESDPALQHLLIERLADDIQFFGDQRLETSRRRHIGSTPRWVRGSRKPICRTKLGLDGFGRPTSSRRAHKAGGRLGHASPIRVAGDQEA